MTNDLVIVSKPININVSYILAGSYRMPVYLSSCFDVSNCSSYLIPRAKLCRVGSDVLICGKFAEQWPMTLLGTA